MNSLKEKLIKKQKIAGTHVRLLDPAVTEMMSNLDFDFLWIDMEHSAIDYGALQSHLIAARAGGTPAVVRVPWNDQILTKRVLDLGADGIVFPMVNTAKEAEYAMKSCIYPPEGFRGAGPTRAAQFSLVPFDRYIGIHKELCRFIQIESETGVNSIEEIVKVPNIDGIIVGPCDLSGSIGDLGNLYSEKNLKMIKRILAAAGKAGIPVGVSLDSNDSELLKFWADMGMTILSSGMDFLSIVSTAQQTRLNIRNAFGEC